MSTAPLAKFPDHIREAHDRWLQTRDAADADRVILAVVAHHLPSRSPKDPLADLPDGARLVEDLGYDSLAIAEIVFFIEDLYGVAISNDDLRAIGTIAELRVAVRSKILPAS